MSDATEGFNGRPNGNGFHITFVNGYTASVQWGAGGYCDNRDSDEYYKLLPKSSNAEVAAWDKDGNWVSFGNDTVMGWRTPHQVLKFLKKIELM